MTGCYIFDSKTPTTILYKKLSLSSSSLPVEWKEDQTKACRRFRFRHKQFFVSPHLSGLTWTNIISCSFPKQNEKEKKKFSEPRSCKFLIRCTTTYNMKLMRRVLCLSAVIWRTHVDKFELNEENSIFTCRIFQLK